MRMTVECNGAKAGENMGQIPTQPQDPSVFDLPDCVIGDNLPQVPLQSCVVPLEETGM